MLKFVGILSDQRSYKENCALENMFEYSGNCYTGITT